MLLVNKQLAFTPRPINQLKGYVVNDLTHGQLVGGLV